MLSVKKDVYVMQSFVMVDGGELCVDFASLTAAQLMEKVMGLQNLAYKLGLEECWYYWVAFII